MTPGGEDLVLGPREISYRKGSATPLTDHDEDDLDGSVLMTLRTLASGEVLGWADLELDGLTARLETRGADEFKAAYDLTLLAGGWFIETAKARGLALFAWGPEPVVGPADVFKL